jgi:hypothetical protein
MLVCHTWPWNKSVLHVLIAASQFEQQANKFFCKPVLSEVENSVSLNIIYRDEVLKNLLGMIGKIKLRVCKNQ